MSRLNHHHDDIQYYLDDGVTIKQIVHILSTKFNVSVSLKTMQRYIKKHGMRNMIRETCSIWIEDVTQLVRGGQNYKNIVIHLKNNYGVKVSVSYLKKILAENDVYANEQVSDDVLDKWVANESSLGNTVGYRAMTVRIRQKYNVNVSQKAISASQSRVDPEGKSERRKKRLSRVIYCVPGPNYIWHLDGFVQKLLHIWVINIF